MPEVKGFYTKYSYISINSKIEVVSEEEALELLEDEKEN